MANKSTPKYSRLILFFLLFLPIWMFIAWYLWPKTHLSIAIIDKTVLTSKGQEHASFNWVLNNNRYVKKNGNRYIVDKDYFGFFPKPEEKFLIKSIEQKSSAEIEQLSSDADMVYVTDAYGIYSNEWYKGSKQGERSGIIYGGLKLPEVDFLSGMKRKHKLIITEFNCLGSPTTANVSEAFSKEFQVTWTGWIGRYFESLDSGLNKELPRWLVISYSRQTGRKWNFTKSGIALVNRNDDVVILEQDSSLNTSIPEIITSEYGTKQYHLPNSITYPFWFDIISADTTVNKVIAKFNIDVNMRGKQMLNSKGIPSVFPAVTIHEPSNKTDYSFYYFSADFCDNPITQFTSFFKGIHFFSFLFYNHFDKAEREQFFWKYYQPLLSTIMENYSDRVQ